MPPSDDKEEMPNACKATESQVNAPPLVVAWDAARSLVDTWEAEHSFGAVAVDLHPIAKGALVRAIVAAISKPVVNQFGEHARTDDRIRMLNTRIDRVENRILNHIDDDDRHMPGTIESSTDSVSKAADSQEKVR